MFARKLSIVSFKGSAPLYSASGPDSSMFGLLLSEKTEIVEMKT